MILLAVIFGVVLGMWIECEPRFMPCDRCLENVQSNKLFFGGLHLCKESSGA